MITWPEVLIATFSAEECEVLASGFTKSSAIYVSLSGMMGSELEPRFPLQKLIPG